MQPVVEAPTLAILYSSTAIATGIFSRGGCGRSTDGSIWRLPSPASWAATRMDPDMIRISSGGGYCASFLASLLAARPQDGPQFAPEAAVQATVGFGLREDGGFGLEITLEVRLPGFERTDAEALIEKARHICSLCDATRKEVLRLELV
jgi:lipoyl-dependent peroxiredoxin